jgi:hypothetical protein
VHGADAATVADVVDDADVADVAAENAGGNHAFHDNYYHDNKICDSAGSVHDNDPAAGDVSVVREAVVDDAQEVAVAKEHSAD